MSKKKCYCGEVANFKYSLSASEINNHLTKHFGKEVNNLVKIDYQMYECTSCSLMFCNPERPGDNYFYNWVVKQPTYYPGFRVEYSKLLDIYRNRKNEFLRLLDVGCGDGIFLEYIKNETKFHIEGLDTTESSVEKCKSKGLKVNKCFIENYYPNEKFDLITSFHVLEHVPNPYGFVQNMLNLLNKNGKIFISTPLSPMSFEYAWLDILNHPPHHISRWTVNAYKRLAETLKCEVDFHFVEDNSILKQVLISILLKEFGKDIPISSWKRMKAMLKNLSHIYKSYMFQRKRYKDFGTLSNTILVEFTKKN